MNQIPNIEEILPTEEDLQKVGQHYWGGDYEPTYQELVNLKQSFKEILLPKIEKHLHHQLQKVREEERERINQFFADKADYDTDNDCVILTDKVYHQAFFPDGCGSDGQDDRNRCEVCYKYRTKFGQNILAKFEPDHSELDQPNK